MAESRCSHEDSRRGLVGRVNTEAWKRSVRSAIAQLGEYVDCITGVGIDVHCPVAIPLDSEGEAVGLGVTWDNSELNEYFERYSNQRSVYAISATGNHPSQSTFLAVAYPYLRHEDPEVFRRMDCFGFAGTWLLAQLTGEGCLDPTQASYSGIFDTVSGKNRWIPETLSLLEIDRAKLPALRNSTDIGGTMSAKGSIEYGIPEGVPVIVGSADTPAASYRLGIRPGGRPFFIMGTTHVISSCLSAPDTREIALQRSGTRQGEWLINGVSNGGDSLAAGAILAGFGEGPDAVSELVAAAFRATVEEISDAPFYVPHVMKERGPLWIDAPCGALVGLKRVTTPSQIAWSIVEGVLLIDRMIVEACTFPNQRTIYMTGAFGATTLLPQMMSDVMGAELLLIENSYLSAVGAAAMCLETMTGTRLSAPEFKRVSPRSEWHEVYEKRFEAYKDHWAEITGHEVLEPLR